MKPIMFTSLLFLSIQLFAQSANDSAYTKNLALRSTTISLLTPKTLDPSNDSLFLVFVKWRTSLRANPVSGNTTVTIDTIPTVELANMYEYVMQLPSGLGIVNIVANQLTAARTANPYLNRLCQAIDDKYAAQLATMLAVGRRLLLGR